MAQRSTAQLWQLVTNWVSEPLIEVFANNAANGPRRHVCTLKRKHFISSLSVLGILRLTASLRWRFISLFFFAGWIINRI